MEDRDCAPVVLLSQWSIPSLAAVIAIQSLPTLAQTIDPSARLERALAGLIDAGFDLESAGQGASFSSLVISRFNPQLFSAGLNQLRPLSIRLLEPEDLDAEDY
ncbi:helicase, partial [Pseudomonas aeruginosa]|nr:helicase [Pseudomonas aeruginosa]